MSAKAEALKFPGASPDRSNRLAVVVAVLLALAVAGTLAVLSSVDSGTTVDRVPAKTVTHPNDAGAAVAPASAVLQVGGTSVYRYHPLPGANTVFELAQPASAAVEVDAGHVVGGTGVHRYHQLP
jgi:hypothetical protein